MRATKHADSGFTLIELSAVLAVIGLIVGGIMGAQVMIRNAQLRSVVGDYTAYKTAVNQFQKQYQAIPGDFVDATEIWGAAHATPSTCTTTLGTGTQTCNGDGDGIVGSTEKFRFWQHLVNAKLIRGKYNGIGTETTASNAPSGKISNSLWHVHHMSTLAATTYWFPGVYNNTFQFGLAYPGYEPANPILRPSEAMGIDIKIDDGKPGTGTLTARAQSGLEFCTDTTTGATVGANYKINATAIGCSLMFRNLF